MHGHVPCENKKKRKMEIVSFPFYTGLPYSILPYEYNIKALTNLYI